MKGIIRYIILILLLIHFYSCKTNMDSIQSNQGYLIVSVIDDIVGPVNDVKITIYPDSLVKKTGINGKAEFRLENGQYFVDANVCCVGPGWIIYHESIEIIKNDTARVELKACLSCL